MRKNALEHVTGLSDLPKISHVFLDFNRLCTQSPLNLATGILATLPNARVLSLVSNDITCSQQAPLFLGELRTLRLSENDLPHVFWPQQGEEVSLRVLHLEGNRFVHLDDAGLHMHEMDEAPSRFTYLEQLHLAHNAIASLSVSSLALAPRLQVLVLTHNAVSLLSLRTLLALVASLPLLRRLDLRTTPSWSTCTLLRVPRRA